MNEPLKRDLEVSPASMTDYKVIRLRTGKTRDGKSRFVTNPTTGALELRPGADLEIQRALNRVARGMRYRLYLSLALLYLEKLWLQCASTVLQLRGYLRGF